MPASDPTIVFDGDDTLWDTQVLYEDAKKEFYRLLETLGHSRADSEHMLTAIDLAAVQELGFSPERFPRSLQNTYVHLSRLAHAEIRTDIQEQAMAIGRRVFQRTPTPRPDAHLVLRVLSGQYRLVLYTAGDEAVQKRRIKQSGLRAFFQGVRITPRKTSESWAELVRQERLLPSVTWSVGNSVRSDVNPAMALGIRSVLVHGGSWDFEQATMANGVPQVAASLREAALFILSSDGLKDSLEASELSGTMSA